MSKSCFVLDINQGCAGYVYGMSVISSLLSSAKFKKGLLLVGDTITKNISKYDKSLMPLFSDAATATAFEHNELASEIFFNTDIDSENFDGIIVPAGGSKKPYSESVDKYIETDGNRRKETHLVMKGLHVFNFSLQKVVPNVEQLLLFAQVEKSKIDNYIFHQANLLILKSLCKKLGISFDKTSSSLINYGNTSSASIPLTIVTSLSKNNLISNQKLLLSGFGVGLSVGSAIIDFEKVVCNEIIEVE